MNTEPIWMRARCIHSCSPLTAPQIISYIKLHANARFTSFPLHNNSNHLQSISGLVVQFEYEKIWVFKYEVLWFSSERTYIPGVDEGINYAQNKKQRSEVVSASAWLKLSCSPKEKMLVGGKWKCTILIIDSHPPQIFIPYRLALPNRYF